MKKNLFIAIEGIDGSGKSTQAKNIAKRLEAEGHKVYLTFEPTDMRIGKMIRSILGGKEKADEKVIAALFAADRLDHVLHETEGILKKLAEGYIVITDRYYFSSYAYHGAHVDMDWVIASNQMAANILKPSVNIFVDVSPEVAMKRINANRETVEIYETLDNLKAVQSQYLRAFKKLQHEEHIVKVNGDESPENVTAALWDVIQNELKTS
ncbi:thymidylate kinase [Kordia periserrulae]|uniref:Thymidylate kinase n=1 Tax=Kordia periserrulae TaxID=701523 RepID=A0A2T6C469_9FLAO|nr:dTMP kinase [Kordia periserrulae]PTX63121.1 thymidylate kinase [Kordia periserrulae]